MMRNENQILAQENASATGAAGQTLWAVTDNNGSVVDVVGNNGSGNAILDHIVYDSFGNTTSQTNSAFAMLMGFDGYIQDSVTGLYYANARFYSSQMGRFINQDPSGFSAGDSNLYRFVGNHPTYATDPTGLFEGGNASGTSGTSGIPTVTTYGSGTLDALAGGASYGGSPGSSQQTVFADAGLGGAITGPTAGAISPGLYAGTGGSGGYSLPSGVSGGQANSFGQLNAGNNTLSFVEPGGGPGMGAIASSLGSMAFPASLTSGGNGLVNPFIENSFTASLGTGDLPPMAIPSAASMAASSATYMQSLSQRYGPSLFGSTALGSAAYSIGQAEVTDVTGAWNYTTSGTDALVHNPSALGLGLKQGGANLGTSIDNFGISLANSVLLANNLLNRGVDAIAGLFSPGAAPLGMAPQIQYFGTSQFVVDPAHGVEMALNNAGLTGLSIGVGGLGEVPAPPSPSVWSLGDFARGNAIEDALGGNLPGNFPTIDRFSNGIVTSIKSIDLNAATYQDTAALSNKLNKYVDAVARFNGRTWGEFDIKQGDITGRQLQVAVPSGAMSPAQQAAFNAATARARNLGVSLVVTPVR